MRVNTRGEDRAPAPRCNTCGAMRQKLPCGKRVWGRNALACAVVGFLFNSGKGGGKDQNCHHPGRTHRLSWEWSTSSRAHVVGSGYRWCWTPRRNAGSMWKAARFALIRSRRAARCGMTHYHEPGVGAFASSRSAAIRFCSVRRLIPNISAASFRFPRTDSRVSWM